MRSGRKGKVGTPFVNSMVRHRESTASRVWRRYALAEYERRSQYPGVDNEAEVMRLEAEEDKLWSGPGTGRLAPRTGHGRVGESGDRIDHAADSIFQYNMQCNTGRGREPYRFGRRSSGRVT